MIRSKIGALPYLALLLPLDLIVATAILAADAAAACIRIWRRRPVEPCTNDDPVCAIPAATVIIVNWDGKHLLAECLPRLLQEAAGCDILVVDNGSTDGSAEFVRETFPAVRVLALEKNYGFAEGNNRGVQHTQSKVVIFLNNDMLVEQGFLEPLLNGLTDPSVFAVTSQIFFADPNRRREETGKTRACFDRGFFHFWHDDISPSDENLGTIPVFWAGGGSCAIDRQKFLAIGGFDPIYHPFYVEDADISYQAWKRGWKCLLAPSSRVIHKHRGTSRPRFGDRFVENTIRKNQYLFVWKNVTDVSMLLAHIIHLPSIHGRSILREGPGFEIRAFVRAASQMPHVLWARLNNIPQYRMTDREVLMLSRKP